MHKIEVDFLTAALSSFVLFMNYRFLIILNFAFIYTLTNANILVLEVKSLAFSIPELRRKL